MNSKSEKYLYENQFFLDKNNKLKFNEKCKKCKNSCKQSYKADVCYCSRFIKK